MPDPSWRGLKSIHRQTSEASIELTNHLGFYRAEKKRDFCNAARLVASNKW